MLLGGQQQQHEDDRQSPLLVCTSATALSDRKPPQGWVRRPNGLLLMRGVSKRMSSTRWVRLWNFLTPRRCWQRRHFRCTWSSSGLDL